MLDGDFGTLKDDYCLWSSSSRNSACLGLFLNGGDLVLFLFGELLFIFVVFSSVTAPLIMLTVASGRRALCFLGEGLRPPIVFPFSHRLAGIV